MRTEDELYNYIKGKYIPDLRKCEDTYSSYDCYSKRYRVDIELKCRRTHYDDLIIEKIKYNALMYRAKVSGGQPLYINSTPQGVYAFNLNDIDIEWSDRSLPKQTDFKDNNFINKRVGYLNISKSKKI